MAVTATLVAIGNNRLRYLINALATAEVPQTGTVTLTTTGGATPDLLTDSVQGPIKKLAKAFADGYAKLAAGAKTQAQARALWLSRDIGQIVSDAGNKLPPTALARLTAIVSPNELNFAVDANVDGGGHPTIVVSVFLPVGFSGSTYLDIEVPEAIGW